MTLSIATFLPTVASPPLFTPKEVDASKLSALYDPDAVANIRLLLKNPAATFRSPMQYYVYKEIMSRKHHCLYVAGCGTGKTLPFVLAVKAWGIAKQSVLVLPYEILHPDMHRCLNEGTFPIANGASPKDHPRNASLQYPLNHSAMTFSSTGSWGLPAIND